MRILGEMDRCLFEITIQKLIPAVGSSSRSNRAVFVLRIALEVAHVHVQRQTELLEVALALYGLRGGLCTRQCRKQQARQNCDDGDHHEHLNQRKARASNMNPPCNSSRRLWHSIFHPQNSDGALLIE